MKVFIGDENDERDPTSFSVMPATDINANCAFVKEKNKQISFYDTIDALPHIDHYRNLFSITSSESKTRPTLEALHNIASIPTKLRLCSPIDLNSDMVNTLVPQAEQPIQVDTKPKIEIVKFGWIVGVFV